MKTGIILTIIIAALVAAGVIGYVSTRGGNQNANTSTVGDRVEADGTIVKPDGTMVKPDGTMVKPDGTMVKPDGTIVKPDGTMVGPDGQVVNENTNTSTTSTNAASTNTNSASNTNSTSSAAPAKYTSYSPSALASAQAVSNGDTVLYFHANWCPICQALDPDLQANINSLPAGLTILKVDYDKETALKKKYGVTYQHTFVQVDAQGNKLKLWSGSTNASDVAGQVL